MNTLRGATVGFLGYGDIAKRTARLCQAFGMKICALKRTITKDDTVELGENVWSSTDEGGIKTFTSRSDFIVCSLPSTPQTKNFCDQNFYSQMKTSAIFISVGRGTVVDEMALIKALESRAIAGAALDVFQVEPLPPDSSLWSFRNCLISSHNADWTETYFEDSVGIFLDNLALYLSGDKLNNLVNLDEGY